jgi:hypothetical protein
MENQQASSSCKVSSLAGGSRPRDDELLGETGEVGNVAAERDLAPKLGAERVATERFPEAMLGIGHGTA